MSVAVFHVTCAERKSANKAAQIRKSHEFGHKECGLDQKTDKKERQIEDHLHKRHVLVDDINAVVNLKVLAELLGIGLLLTLIGSLASMIAISRFSPLTILKERS